MSKVWKCPSLSYPEYFDDMAQREHILIGGVCGSGKSVTLEGFIFSLLAKAPCEAQLILIDPKRVELAQFKNLPHTLSHVYRTEDIDEALIYAEEIMERRYEIMEQRGEKLFSGSDIYIIIDEYAKIGGKHGEGSKRAIKALANIAFMGRASKIHIVACTQRPTQDVLEGLIKNNITTVVALRTNTAQESRNLIGQSGCETFPDRGKAYYSSPTSRTIKSINIEKVPEDLMAKYIRFWEEQK